MRIITYTKPLIMTTKAVYERRRQEITMIDDIGEKHISESDEEAQDEQDARSANCDKQREPVTFSDQSTKVNENDVPSETM